MCSAANATGNIARAFLGASRGTFSRASKRCHGIFFATARLTVEIIKLCGMLPSIVIIPLRQIQRSPWPNPTLMVRWRHVSSGELWGTRCPTILRCYHGAIDPVAWVRRPGSAQVWTIFNGRSGRIITSLAIHQDTIINAKSRRLHSHANGVAVTAVSSASGSRLARPSKVVAIRAQV